MYMHVCIWTCVACQASADTTRVVGDASKPRSFAAKIKIKDAEYYEKLIHKLLSKYRYRKGREFFKLDLDQIKMCLKQVSQISEKGSKKLTLAKMQKEIKL